MRKTVPVGALVLALALVVCALLRTGGDEPGEPKAPLRPGPSSCLVTGRVLTADGSPLPGSRVLARILERGLAHEVDCGVTDGDGGFRARLFPPRGLWDVSARPPGRAPFRAEAPVRAEAGTTIELVLREVPLADTPLEANLTGEVIDSYCRLLTGIPIVAHDEAGNVLARTVSGEGGRFEMYVEPRPEFFVKVESDESSIRLDHLPYFDMVLHVENIERQLGELVVHVELKVDVPTVEAQIVLYDSLGQRARRVYRRLSDAPFRIEALPYDPYDVMVVAGDYVGSVQGFDFSAPSRDVLVRVGRAASVRGDVTRPAQVHLISKSPTRVPLGRGIRENDGIDGRVRGVLAKRGPTDAFEVTGLPAGEYLLRIFGKGMETVEVVLDLAEGEERDLGLIEIQEARGVISVVVNDGPGGLEFPYLVSLYDGKGLVFERELSPGPGRMARFERLPAGRYHYRAERLLDGRGHSRQVGWDVPVVIGENEEKTVQADCTWRY